MSWVLLSLDISCQILLTHGEPCSSFLFDITQGGFALEKHTCSSISFFFWPHTHAFTDLQPSAHTPQIYVALRAASLHPLCFCFFLFVSPLSPITFSSLSPPLSCSLPIFPFKLSLQCYIHRDFPFTILEGGIKWRQRRRQLGHIWTVYTLDMWEIKVLLVQELKQLLGVLFQQKPWTLDTHFYNMSK